MKVEQLQTPALIVDLDRLEENIATMNRLTAPSGAAMRPHYKTNKCTAIAHMQLAAGAKGITCSKLSEARDVVEAGVEDVLIANQIVDPAKLAQVAALANCCRLTIAVDNYENVQALERAAAAQNATIHCLVEYEIGMGRCGVSSREALWILAKAITESPHLVFEGIQAYAGHMSHEPSPQVRAEHAAAIEQQLRSAKAYLQSKGIAVKEISGCSTASVADHVMPDTVYTEFQCGSYVFMDAAYRPVEGLPFQNSLFVVTTVMSKGNGKIITDAGMKTLSTDQTLPLFVGYENIAPEMSEEHCALPIQDENVKLGQRLLVIPGHCCTTVNLFDHVYFVRGGKVVDKVPVTSRGGAQ